MVDEGGKRGGLQRDAEGAERGEERRDEREEPRAREAVQHARRERVVVQVARRGEERGRGGHGRRKGLEVEEERVRLRRGLWLVGKLLRAAAAALYRGGGRHRASQVVVGGGSPDPVFHAHMVKALVGLG